MMDRKKYFQTEYECIKGQKTQKLDNLSFYQGLNMARAYFNNGITLLIFDQDNRAREFIRESALFFNNYLLSNFYLIENNLVDSSDYLRLYYIKWIYNSSSMQHYLTKAIDALEKNIYYKIFQWGNREIYDTLNKNIVSKFTKINYRPVLPRKNNFLKYDYEEAARMLLMLTRIYCINTDFETALGILKNAQYLCQAALQKMPYMLSQDNSRWIKFEKATDLEIKENGGPGAMEYLQERHRLRQNILYYLKQIEVLLGYSKSYSAVFTYNRTKMQTIFDNFFNKYISNPDMKHRNMDLVEELMWVQLKDLSLPKEYFYVKDYSIKKMLKKYYFSLKDH
ncbi:MAG: hypothetical protein ACLFQV_04580 [Vulcanimicrobiota bacterium]